MGFKKTKIYHIQIWTAMSMILVLLWLTVSLPFIYHISISLDDTHHMSSYFDNSNSEDIAERFMTNNTEEKGSENPNTFNEEYLHEFESGDAPSMTNMKVSKSEHGEDLTIAYHGELHVPPPNHS